MGIVGKFRHKEGMQSIKSKANERGSMDNHDIDVRATYTMRIFRKAISIKFLQPVSSIFAS